MYNNTNNIEKGVARKWRLTRVKWADGNGSIAVK